jgi:hypothetical protein
MPITNPHLPFFRLGTASQPVSLYPGKFFKKLFFITIYYDISVMQAESSHWVEGRFQHNI